MRDDNAFTQYRRASLGPILGALWLAWLALIPTGLANGSDKLPYALILGAALLASPTRGLLRGDTGPQLRLMLGVAVAVMPAMLVGVLAGSRWQMDAHMAFFVALSMLLPLCDWRPIVVAGGLIALHHLLLLYLLPEWVFEGSGSLGRVMLHGVLVAVQVAILVYVTQRLRTLVLKSEATRGDAESARDDAEAARSQVQTALDELRTAQALGAQRLAERRAAEAAHAAERGERRMAIADDIQARVGAIAAELRDAAASLSANEGALEGVSMRLLREAKALRGDSERALDYVLTVSESSEQLGQAAGEAGTNALQASRLVGDTEAVVDGLAPRMAALHGEIAAARSILDLVSEIAAQSNLLALNATIEAARSGDAGKGFGVVAHEMKAMATRTAAATIQIHARLETIAGAAGDFAGTIETTTSHMRAAGVSATAVSAAVEQQRQAIGLIGRAAGQAMQQASATDSRSRTIGEAASENQAIASRAAVLARLLDTRARALGDSVETLLGDLRAA